MSFGTKFASFGRGFTQGLAPGVQLGLQVGSQNRQERRMQRAEDRDVENQIRARFSNGDRDGAVSQAKSLGLTRLAEELSSAFPAAQAESLRQTGTLAGQQAGRFAGTLAGTNVSSPEAAVQSRGNIAGALADSTALTGTMESLAGMSPTPGVGPDSTPGVFQESPATLGVSADVRGQMFTQQQLQDQASQTLSGLDRYVSTYRQMDDFATPEEEAKQLEAVRSAFVQAGGNAADWPAQAGEMKRQAERARGQFLLQSLPLMGTGNAVQKAVLRFRPDLSTAVVADSYAKLLDKKEGENVTEVERLQIQTAQQGIQMALTFAGTAPEVAQQITEQTASDLRALGDEDGATHLLQVVPKMIIAAGKQNWDQFSKTAIVNYINDPTVVKRTMEANGFTFGPTQVPSLEEYTGFLRKAFNKVDPTGDSAGEIVQQVLNNIPIVAGPEQETALARVLGVLDRYPTTLRQQVLDSLNVAGISLDPATGRLKDGRMQQARPGNTMPFLPESGNSLAPENPKPLFSR
ncbi:MAG: hypothetical protein WC786_06360 [Patescibacteria group bacterium]|jgi:hypothetical protein